MTRQPIKKLTKAQLRILGDLIAITVLNGIDPRAQPFTCDGRAAAGMFKKGMIEVDPNTTRKNNPTWLITEVGIESYWRNK